MPSSPSFFNQSAANNPIMQAYAADPRRALAQSLIASGSNTGPVNSPVEGLARLASALVGGYQNRQLRNEYKERQNRYGETIEQGLREAVPWRAPDDIMSAPPDTLQQGLGPMPERPDAPGSRVVVPQGQNAPGTGGREQLIQALLANRDTVDLAAQLRFDQIGRNDDIANALTLEREKNRLKPPTTRDIQRDRLNVTQEYDPVNNKWVDVASGPMDGPKEPPPDVGSYQFAQTPAGGGFTGTFEQWKRAGSPGAQEQFGNTPIWGSDEKGNPVLMQPSSRGGLRVAQLPPGVTAQRGQTSRVDMGTQWAVLDANGAVIGYVPKDVAGEKREGAIGTAQGEQAAAAPTAIVKADEMLATIDSILDDPALSKSVGLYAGLQKIPATPQFAFGQKALQLQGQAFVKAYQDLKGGGAITETEGKAGTQAIGRLSTAQDEQSYRTALKELRGIIANGRERQLRMTRPTTGAPPAGGGSAASTLSPAEQEELNALQARFRK